MVWPFKWNLFSSTFTWYYLYLSILWKEIWDLSLILILGTLGSKRVRVKMTVSLADGVRAQWCLVVSMLDFRSEGQRFKTWFLPLCCFSGITLTSTQVYNIQPQQYAGIMLQWNSTPSKRSGSTIRWASWTR